MKRGCGHGEVERPVFVGAGPVADRRLESLRGREKSPVRKPKILACLAKFQRQRETTEAVVQQIDRKGGAEGGGVSRQHAVAPQKPAGKSTCDQLAAVPGLQQLAEPRGDVIAVLGH